MTRSLRSSYPGFWHSVLLCVAFLVLQLVLTSPFGIVDAFTNSKSLSNPAVLGIISIVACALVLWGASLIGGLQASEICSLRRVGWVVLLAVVVSTTGATLLLGELNTLLYVLMPPPAWMRRLLASMFSPEYPVGSFFLLVMVAPVTEELLFRGVILRGLLQRFKVASAVLLSSVLFMIVHLNPWQFPTALGLGLMLGFWYARTRSLIPCLIGHAVANALAFCIFMVQVKVRGHITAELEGAGSFSPWLCGAGLLLLAAGSRLFLHTAPVLESTAGAVTELNQPGPSVVGEPPVIAADSEPTLDLNKPARRPRTAIASFVLGLFSISCVGFLAGLPAILLGYKARRQIERAPEQFKGPGLALAGMTLGWVSLIPTLFFAWVAATMLFPGSDNPIIAPVQSTGCISNLEGIGVAFEAWAQSHGGNFPMTTAASIDGISADLDADAGLLAFRQLSVELQNPGRLVCPADPSAHRALDFGTLEATNISYCLQSGPEIKAMDPATVLVRCPIHGHELLCDGTVRRHSERPPW